MDYAGILEAACVKAADVSVSGNIRIALRRKRVSGIDPKGSRLLFYLRFRGSGTGRGAGIGRGDDAREDLSARVRSHH